MKARYSAEARLEFLRAVAYLEEQRDRLGVEFAMAVREGIREIVAHPFSWPELNKGERRYRLRRFAYGIVYTIGADDLEVIAVMHMHRRPGYWRRRRR